MQFKLRSNHEYVDVMVSDGSTTIDLGLLNKKERLRLAEELLHVVSDLIYNDFPEREDYRAFIGVNT